MLSSKIINTKNHVQILQKDDITMFPSCWKLMKRILEQGHYGDFGIHIVDFE